jgi:hypothetical protein
VTELEIDENPDLEMNFELEEDAVVPEAPMAEDVPTGSFEHDTPARVVPFAASRVEPAAGQALRAVEFEPSNPKTQATETAQIDSASATAPVENKIEHNTVAKITEPHLPTSDEEESSHFELEAEETQPISQVISTPVDTPIETEALPFDLLSEINANLPDPLAPSDETKDAVQHETEETLASGNLATQAAESREAVETAEITTPDAQPSALDISHIAEDPTDQNDVYASIDGVLGKISRSAIAPADHPALAALAARADVLQRKLLGLEGV